MAAAPIGTIWSASPCKSASAHQNFGRCDNSYLRVHLLKSFAQPRRLDLETSGGESGHPRKHCRNRKLVGDRLYSVIFEIREVDEGEIFHLVTLWKSTKEEVKLYEENS